jgi:hypothetical protein
MPVTTTSVDSNGISDTIRRIAYPSPFFDISRKYLPSHIKEIMAWTQYFYAISSVINPIVNKLSEYPVTDIMYGNIDESQRKSWERILEHSIDIRSFLIELHTDYFVYGNGFAMFHAPFVRYLACTHCKHKETAKSVKYTIVIGGGSWAFQGVCQKCKQTTKYKIEDIIIRNKSKARVTRVSPLNMEIEHNEFNGDTVYIYKIPRSLKRSIIGNVKVALDTTDKLVIDAIVANKDIQLDNDRIFHMKRPTMASLWKGWGTPALLPVLKDIHYYYVLRKANEALALQRIVPLMILFPQANADVTPFQHLNLGNWRSQVEEELSKWRRDPNYVPIMPLPIGNQLLGGDAKQMMVTQEQEMVGKSIAAGLGVPIEFIMGGLSWTGSSVSLRILENAFLNLRNYDLKFINQHLIPKLARVYKMPKIEVQFTKFKMADDIQAKSQAFNLMQAGFLSRKSVLEQDGYNNDTEMEQMEKEHITLNRIQNSDMLATQEMQNVLQIMQTKNQIIAQNEGQKLVQEIQQQVAGQNEEVKKLKIEDMADQYAKTILSQEPQISAPTLERMKNEMPNLYSLVMNKIKNFAPSLPQQTPQAQPMPMLQPEVPPQVDLMGQGGTGNMLQMKPLPEKGVPRRATGGI